MLKYCQPLPDHLEFMICKTLSIVLLFTLLVARPAGAGSVPSDAAAITTAVNGFHDALHRGDSLAALNLLAPDAVILESGSSQTRGEYAREHLAEDIAFVKAVPGTRSKLSIKQEGNIAWTTAKTQSVGTLDGREVNSAGVELMVLTKTDLGWRIRAIHWSSHKMTKAE
jgi:ketosteroid isomerase-like protein